MLERKLYKTLLEWKRSEKKECLLIKGARQVGKTYLVRAFGKKEYESFIEINFQEQSSLKAIFSGDKTADEIYKRMTANIPAIKLIPGRTLIFLDEIQKCADARTALKFMAQDARYDVIASGSLLGLRYGDDDDEEVGEIESVPVGYERAIMMHSLDFEEFLWAYGYDATAVSYLKEAFDGRKKIPTETNDRFESVLREFLVVGGMPEVVADFMLHKDFGRVQGLQEKILASYADDIAQHAKGVEKAKVRKCYDSIPRQLARENKKFKYSEVEKKSTSRKYGDSVQWLCDACLAHMCRNLSLPELPLNAYEKETEFKLYMNDTGLLLALYGFAAKQALLNGKLKGEAKGGIYENFVAETLVKNGYALHYFKPDDSHELEFVIERNGGAVPLEVKAGNEATASLNSFIDEYGPSIAFKLIGGNVGESGVKLSIPHYLAMFI